MFSSRLLDGFRQMVLGFGDLIADAWGRQKVVLDYSLFHGVFTTSVPDSIWKKYSGGVEVSTSVDIESFNGMLRVFSNGVSSRCQSWRNPRYQPNRGHLYSSSIMIPDPNADANRDFGLGTTQNGVFFRVRGGKLYACRRWRYNNADNFVEREITKLPKDFDLSKGNIYDIQMQWRGVGNIAFYVGDPETGTSKLVYKMKLLGTLDKLSVLNPGMPAFFESTFVSESGELLCGCVDITTEGGGSEGTTYTSFIMRNQEGQVAISGYNQPIIAVRSKSMIGSEINTRDALLLRLSAYADQRCVFRMWKTRDDTAITLNDQSWEDRGDGNLEFTIYDDPDVVTPMTFDTSKADLIFGVRVDQDTTYTTSALFEDRANLYMHPGDIYFFTMHRETGGAANVGVVYRVGEEI